MAMARHNLRKDTMDRFSLISRVVADRPLKRSAAKRSGNTVRAPPGIYNRPGATGVRLTERQNPEKRGFVMVCGREWLVSI
jgi:hypothetical protein